MPSIVIRLTLISEAHLYGSIIYYVDHGFLKGQTTTYFRMQIDWHLNDEKVIFRELVCVFLLTRRCILMVIVLLGHEL